MFVYQIYPTCMNEMFKLIIYKYVERKIEIKPLSLFIILLKFEAAYLVCISYMCLCNTFVLSIDNHLFVHHTLYG